MVRFLVMDVDGTLTDGKIYIGESGELFKAFDVKDGFGIKEILPAHEIVPIIITARESNILENRCRELGIREVYQGVHNKYAKMKEIIEKLDGTSDGQFCLADCAYIGDDILDLQCMEPIKSAGGMIGCPSDAVVSVQRISDFIASRKGGEGAVREFIEWLIDNNKIGN